MGLALLLRHARAGRRPAWTGDDGLRPLDERGREQARLLPSALQAYAIERILSSPAVRCLQTVEPLALAVDLPVEERADLAEGTPGRKALAVVLAAGPGAVSCTHGDVLHALTGDEGPKGGAFVVELDAEGLAVVQRVPAP
jgi:phosphohistidine phosphatase SixA